MGKMIKISTRNEVSILDFPEEDRRETLCRSIGGDCRLYQHVRARGLYEIFGLKDVCMLVDEEFCMGHKELGLNRFASFLYGGEIKGDILVVGEVWVDGSLDICPLSREDAIHIIESFVGING